MQAWSDGYMTDVEYTHGYYAELNPLRARLALLNAGHACPEVRTACELGFGQGLSVNLHGAATATEWYGTDFNPVQAAFARELAGDPVRAARLFDDAFDAFCRRDDLPDFDFIGLHGIWSWVSDANRAVIAEFIRRKLKVGGVLYISYNTQPGWAAIAPLRDLLTGFSDSMTAPGLDTAQRIEASLAFAERLMASGALFGKSNPAALEELKRLATQPRNYLAHEYFNRDWTPMPFSRMAEWMGSLKLQFAGSAHPIDHLDILNLNDDQARLLGEIPDRHLREAARDLMVNQRFRRDYWIRGARRLSPLEQAERQRAERVVLAEPAAAVKLVAQGPLGEGNLKEEVYRPILDALADHQPRQVGEIERTVAASGIGLAQVLQALTILAGNGVLHPAQDEQAVRQARAATDALNVRLCRQARYAADVAYLASPVTGGGIPAGRFDQLFLLARGAGLAAPGEWAQYASALLDAQGQRLVKDGKTVDAGQPQLAALNERAAEFATMRLPVLEALGIA